MRSNLCGSQIDQTPQKLLSYDVFISVCLEQKFIHKFQQIWNFLISPRSLVSVFSLLYFLSDCEMPTLSDDGRQFVHEFWSDSSHTVRDCICIRYRITYIMIGFETTETNFNLKQVSEIANFKQTWNETQCQKIVKIFQSQLSLCRFNIDFTLWLEKNKLEVLSHSDQHTVLWHQSKAL